MRLLTQHSDVTPLFVKNNTIFTQMLENNTIFTQMLGNKRPFVLVVSGGGSGGVA